MSLSDFLKRELARSAKQRTLQEWLERTRRLKPIRGGPSSAEIIRKMRDAGDRF